MIFKVTGLTLGVRGTGGKRKAGLIVAIILVAILVWAWWDGGEQPLDQIVEPVKLPIDLAEGQE